ncbi:MAG: hypothetical protein RPG89_01120 [Microcystis panniformis WG22]|nr:hypothetical protein [Microcystis panniformis WG22]
MTYTAFLKKMKYITLLPQTEKPVPHLNEKGCNLNEETSAETTGSSEFGMLLGGLSGA